MNKHAIPPRSIDPVFFDPGVIQRMFEGDQSTFSKCVALFEQHTGPALAAIEDALRAADLEEIGQVAHRVRGGAAALGALALAGHCGVIERMDSLDPQALRQQLHAATKAYHHFLVESRVYLVAHTGGIPEDD
ncbi:Hpt domain-containing protein [Ramlibacter sp. AN1133]|uniref:Hpt domain-containing protein n=1 Tax=Ramlibacter sp. AN1133 TaxID=3133429 RepID=UPI0030BA37F5